MFYLKKNPNYAVFFSTQTMKSNIKSQKMDIITIIKVFFQKNMTIIDKILKNLYIFSIKSKYLKFTLKRLIMSI